MTVGSCVEEESSKAGGENCGRWEVWEMGGLGEKIGNRKEARRLRPEKWGGCDEPEGQWVAGEFFSRQRRR